MTYDLLTISSLKILSLIGNLRGDPRSPMVSTCGFHAAGLEILLFLNIPSLTPFPSLF